MCLAALGICWALSRLASKVGAAVVLVDSMRIQQPKQQALPEEVANTVSATAAESLLMGIFILVCSFEFRGVKAGLVVQRGSHLMPQMVNPPGAALSRATSSVVDQSQAASLMPFPKGSGASELDDEAGSIYGVDDSQDVTRRVTPGEPEFGVAEVFEHDDKDWQLGPLVMMMILLHVIYPSFPISPQVEMGRIMTFLGFLWSVGPMRCIAVVNTEPMHNCRLLLLTLVCVAVHMLIFVMTDTISDLIFPQASSTVDLYHGPRYLHQLLMYLAIRYPVRNASFGPWAAWCVVSAVVFSSAVWKEFLFRGIYLGGLRTKMPFWAANITASLIYALAHEPMFLSGDGTVRLHIVAMAPLLMSSMWYCYMYHSCNNLLVTVLAHLTFNATLLWLHLRLDLTPA